MIIGKLNEGILRMTRKDAIKQPSTRIIKTVGVLQDE